MGTKSTRAKNKRVVVECDLVEGPIFSPTHILDRKNARPATWGKQDVEALKEECGLPPSAVIRLLQPDERADWVSDGWVCFYEYPFRIGYAYPFSPLVRGVLRALAVPPAQLMPQVWRVMHLVDHLAGKLDMEFRVEDLVYTYKVQNYGAGRYLLHVKDDREALLGADKSNDRGWMGRFFFVELASLGSDSDFLTGEWMARGICLFFGVFGLVDLTLSHFFVFVGASFDTVGVGAEAIEKTVVLLEIPLKDRAFVGTKFEREEPQEEEISEPASMSTSTGKHGLGLVYNFGFVALFQITIVETRLSRQ